MPAPRKKTGTTKPAPAKDPAPTETPAVADSTSTLALAWARIAHNETTMTGTPQQQSARAQRANAAQTIASYLAVKALEATGGLPAEVKQALARFQLAGPDSRS